VLGGRSCHLRNKGNARQNLVMLAQNYQLLEFVHYFRGQQMRKALYLVGLEEREPVPRGLGGS